MSSIRELDAAETAVVEGGYGLGIVVGAVVILAVVAISLVVGFYEAVTN